LSPVNFCCGYFADNSFVFIDVRQTLCYHACP
jgi:hypothetical protein